LFSRPDDFAQRAFEDVRADVLIMETTRGNREVPKDFTREKEIERLVAAIHEAQKRKGCILIPSFALGRTQEMLAMLALLMREGKLKKQPVYIGGLGRVFTEIYDLEAHRAHRKHTNLQLHEALQLTVLEKGHAENMKLSGGKIFVITAGMMSENTAAHDLAARMIGGRAAEYFLRRLRRPGFAGGKIEGGESAARLLFSAQARGA